MIKVFRYQIRKIDMKTHINKIKNYSMIFIRTLIFLSNKIVSNLKNQNLINLKMMKLTKLSKNKLKKLLFTVI
jgi:hypothetical protein